MSNAPATRPRRALLARAAAGALLSAGLLASAALPAQAATGAAVVDVADDYLGTPYRYGGTTPAGFDCSGYTQYVLGRVGVSLPRTANAQLQASRRISAGEARPGDLVFFTSGSGRAYHVGVYAGNGRIFDSPRAGRSVSQRAIWTSAVVYGRVI